MSWPPRQRMALPIALVAVGLLILTACTGQADVESAGVASSAPSESIGEGPQILEEVEETDYEDVVSALDNPNHPDLPDPLIDTSRIISGGPPPDGIPPIDVPRFEPAGDVDWLEPQEPVLALEIDGQARAYPVQIMIWHEIVNDTVSGTPVAVTYCPLCNSALAFDRRVADRVVTFGTSGSLYQSDLVMYDRQTESLWPQIEGRAAVGVLTGADLERIPVATVPWEQWRSANPDGWVLSRETGAERDYGSNPYEGYDRADSDPFLFEGDADPRLPPKERVVAIDGTDPVAVPLSRVAEQRVVETEVDGKSVVILGVRGLNSALDSGTIAKGREIAATGVFQPRARGRQLTFTARGGDQFQDAQTGSTWNILGQAVDGPLEGEQLVAVPHVDTFWFAWAAFKPDTRLEQ